MNKQNTMQPLGETKSLQNIVIDEVCQKISDAVIDAEATSEEKYITKQKLIVSADDMNTQEQLVLWTEITTAEIRSVGKTYSILP